MKWRRCGSRDRPWSAGPQSTPFIFLLVIVSQNGRLRRRARRQRGGRPGNPSPASRTRLEIKLSPLAPARFTGGRALVVLNLGSRQALRDDAQWERTWGFVEAHQSVLRQIATATGLRSNRVHQLLGSCRVPRDPPLAQSSAAWSGDGTLPGPLRPPDPPCGRRWRPFAGAASGWKRLECGELVVVDLRPETALREQTDKNQRPPVTVSSAVRLLHGKSNTEFEAVPVHFDYRITQRARGEEAERIGREPVSPLRSAMG